MGLRSVLVFAALFCVGCGSSVQHATVGPSVATAPLATPASTASGFDLDRAHSRVEVAGSDRITGEHIALIRDLSVSISEASGSIAEVVIVADLRSLEMSSKLVEDFVKSEDFLDVERYPRAVFRSTRIERVSGSKFWVRGVLDLHGVAREIEFNADLTQKSGSATLLADFMLPRQAFDIRRRDGWDFLISDDFRVKVQIAARGKVEPGRLTQPTAVAPAAAQEQTRFLPARLASYSFSSA